MRVYNIHGYIFNFAIIHFVKFEECRSDLKEKCLRVFVVCLKTCHYILIYAYVYQAISTFGCVCVCGGGGGGGGGDVIELLLCHDIVLLLHHV